ncbi:MAG TPA: hypothetical protein VJH95_04475 [Candidatus Nanoarchaeia archaeon]|nr:hypothetical protein [Candidatus Nanoarchaeia archaeon]
MLEDELLKNIRTILSSAELVYSTRDFTSSTILYFKAIFLVTDLLLLRLKGKTPKDHTERFRMLESSDKNLYEFMDKYFKVYRDTYTLAIDKETCDKLRENVKRIIKQYKIQV